LDPASNPTTNDSSSISMDSVADPQPALVDDYTYWGYGGVTDYRACSSFRTSFGTGSGGILPGQLAVMLRSKRVLAATFNYLVHADVERLLPVEVIAGKYESLLKDVIYAEYYGPGTVELALTILRNALPVTGAEYSTGLMLMAASYLDKAYGNSRFPAAVPPELTAEAVMLLPLAKLSLATGSRPQITLAAFLTCQHTAEWQVS
jgi:hypothetical protein